MRGVLIVFHARFYLLLSGCRCLHVLACSGTVFLSSFYKRLQVNLPSDSELGHVSSSTSDGWRPLPPQKWLGRCRLPAEVPHPGGGEGSAKKLHTEQRNGLQRLQTVSLRPGSRSGPAAVHRSRFLADVLETLMRKCWQTERRIRAPHFFCLFCCWTDAPNHSRLKVRVSLWSLSLRAHACLQTCCVYRRRRCHSRTEPRRLGLCAPVKLWRLWSYLQAELNLSLRGTTPVRPLLIAVIKYSIWDSLLYDREGWQHQGNIYYSDSCWTL